MNLRNKVSFLLLSFVSVPLFAQTPQQELERLQQNYIQSFVSNDDRTVSLVELLSGIQPETEISDQVAERIYIFGVRSTAAIANFLAYYFEMIFDNVRVITSGSQTETFEQIFRITDKDVMIGISFPRYSSMSVEAMDFARSRGAHAIAITDSMVSPLVQSADSVLIARSDMASIVDSLVAPLSLINALIVATVLKKKDEVSDTFRRLELVWNRDGVYTNRDREIMGNIEDDDK